MPNLGLETGWKVFVDGACIGNPGAGGYGWLIANAYGVTEGGGQVDHTTNNRMEIQAAIEALTQLHGTPGLIQVYCDATYVIDGATKWIPGWKKRNWMTVGKTPVKNRDQWETLDSLIQAREGSGYSIEWHHVPAHAGVIGNERVDQIATAFALAQSPVLLDVARADYPHDLDDLSRHPERASPKPTRWYESRHKVGFPRSVAS